MVKTVRVGFINITGISGVAGNRISIDTAARALNELIVKATVSEFSVITRFMIHAYLPT